MGSRLKDVKDVDHASSRCWIVVWRGITRVVYTPSTSDGSEVLDDDGKERLWICLVGLDVGGERWLAYLWNCWRGWKLEIRNASQRWLRRFQAGQASDRGYELAAQLLGRAIGRAQPRARDRFRGNGDVL